MQKRENDKNSHPLFRNHGDMTIIRDGQAISSIQYTRLTISVVDADSDDRFLQCTAHTRTHVLYSRTL